jgi:hypothetical protein
MTRTVRRHASRAAFATRRWSGWPQGWSGMGAAGKLQKSLAGQDGQAGQATLVAELESSACASDCSRAHVGIYADHHDHPDQALKIKGSPEVWQPDQNTPMPDRADQDWESDPAEAHNWLATPLPDEGIAEPFDDSGYAAMKRGLATVVQDLAAEGRSARSIMRMFGLRRDEVREMKRRRR